MPDHGIAFLNNFNNVLSATTAGAIEFVVLDGDPKNIERNRKSIRSQAARSSAATRRATIVKKQAARLLHTSTNTSLANGTTAWHASSKIAAVPQPQP